WEGWAILLRQKQKKLIMLPSETMIWQPEFTDKTLSRKIGAVQPFRILFRGKNLSVLSMRAEISKQKIYGVFLFILDEVVNKNWPPR
ncbi:hypothetical protein GP680_21835, partial [Escherichia coli]|nr:hypothetical protein [Escherichia coli]